MERKNPAGITSNPAYFMVFPFSGRPAMDARSAEFDSASKMVCR
jgi:hypothetical protein